MKTTPCLWRSTLGLLLAATWAVADSPSESGGTQDPYSQLDPDGIPLSVTQIQQRKPTPAEVESYRKQMEQAASNKNWLLHNYQQQQLIHDQSGSKDQSANLYYQLSSNKALAKLAGLPNSASSTGASFKTGATPAAALRKDPTSSRMSTDLSKPLISPLNSPAGVSGLAAPFPTTMSSPFAGILPQGVSAPQAEQKQEITDLDTPGLTAERKDPLSDMSSSNLTLDILPGESIKEARAHQDSSSKAELTLPMNAELLHRQQAAASTAPTANKTTQSAPPPPVKTAPEDDPSAPLPVSQVPQINPVREPIASPFDFNHR